jgi:Zn-dependent protease with chaperone function
MDQARFEALVQRLTRRAQAQPLRYRLEVLGLAAFGYLYLLVLVLGAALFSLALVAVCLLKPIFLLKLLKLVWLPIWFAWSVLRSLWVRIDPPQGRELRAGEAPRLFAEIERIRNAMGAARPHRVLVTDDYNAAVSQVPRLGVFGWPRSYLIVGLPLMAALSTDQFRAVLAHEFGHLCAGDSRMTGRIYQMRITWMRLQQQFERRGGFMIRPFMRWFIPYFNAYSFVLARAQEYAADRESARIVGAAPAGEALVLAGIGHDYQQKQVWQPLWGRAREEEQPSVLPYTRLLDEGRARSDWSDAAQRLQQALQQKTDWSDTHPALSERLGALGRQAAVPSVEGATAAQELLGEMAQTLAAELDKQWQASVAEGWRKHFQETDARRKELAALLEQAGQAPLDRDSSWKAARLTEQLQDSAAALPLYLAFLGQYPDDAGGLYSVGRIRLDRGEEAGLELIERAMQADLEAIKPGAELSWRFLNSQGRTEEAERYRQRWLERERIEQEARAERANFTAGDEYEAHGLPPETVQGLMRQLKELRFVSKAWLVRKQVKHGAEQPPYLLLVRKRRFDSTAVDSARSALERLAAVPAETTIGVYNGNLAKLFKRVGQVKGGLVFRRPLF